MKKHILRPLAAAAGLACALSAHAVDIDFSGSNIYMKFLDGNQRRVSTSSGDTASGADNGQWTEFELRMKATISKQVEAGVRIQSRSPAAYWTDFGFADEATPTRAKWMKLRGAYVLLTPGYNWLDTALIGSSDWGQFDAFTVGQVRYIDRDNYNGLYFKGPLPVKGASWEFGRLSLPNYLQSNYGQGPNCCSSDDTQFNEAVYIGQVKAQLGPVKLTSSYQWFRDHVLDGADTDPFDGRRERTFSKNNVFMLKGEGSIGPVDLRGTAYHSEYRVGTGVFDQPWINSPKNTINDKAFKIDVALNSLPVSGLSVNYQYFNIGAGFYSNTASRRENDVLLTEGSEAAWYRWGEPLWIGGAAKDYQQGPASAKCHSAIAVNGACAGDLGLKQSANGLTDNAFTDFDEAPAESVQGWKGHTLLVNWEVAKTPLSLEYTRVGYDYNWQGYSATGPLSNFFNLNNNRKTSILVAKASHVLPVAGGLELSAKYKRVMDKNTYAAADPDDDLKVTDSGWVLGVGNQLFKDLYGSLSYGQYSRDYKLGSLATLDNDKKITSLRLQYNLAGFETGVLAQWISGNAKLNELSGATGLSGDVKQYRMKAFVKAIF
jgi:hypothetical protein